VKNQDKEVHVSFFIDFILIFNTKYMQNSKFQDLAGIEAYEAET